MAIIKSKSARLLDKTRKELHTIFEQFDLKISAEVNLKVVNFLDVTFDLNNAKHKPYRKPNDDPLYINRHSNYPPSITRQLPTAIKKSIALLSSDEQTFKESMPIYQNALRHSNFDHEFTYTHEDASQRTRRNRQRNIIWFNPPFSKSVNTNIGREFLSLIDKHFPLQHKLHKFFNRNTLKICYSCKHKLHKFFNRNTLKICYSCMNNVKSIITKHNAHIIRNSQSQNTETDNCNCDNKITFPLPKQCKHCFANTHSAHSFDSIKVTYIFEITHHLMIPIRMKQTVVIL